MYKYGLKPPRVGEIKLRLATYANYSVLPSPPAEFGHYDMVEDWGILANGDDSAHPNVMPVGDCAIAAACHQTALWCAESKTPVSFSPETAIVNYSAIAGFDPKQTAPDGSNPTDNGTGLGELASYWQSTGIVDDAGNRHKIVAVVDLNPGDLRELWTAMWLFQTVTLAFSLPESADRQFANGEPWDWVPFSSIKGGHCIPGMGRKSGQNVGNTWGRLQPFTDAFYERYSMGGFVGLSEEMLVKGASIDGFDDQLLRADLAKLGAV